MEKKLTAAIQELAQWVIDNRYPKSEEEKTSDLEMFHTIVDTFSELTKANEKEPCETEKPQMNIGAVFLLELADLMKKHNATIEIERVYENEYESHAELSFKVNERYLDDLFSASGTFNSISADDIYKRLS
jgi:hypothetical protein